MMDELIDDMKDMKLAIFDLDGIIYRGNKLIPGVDKIIEILRNLNIQIVFNSNNSTLTRQMYVEKLNLFNVSCSIDDIFTSAYIAAEEITELKEKANIYVIGEKGLKEELKTKAHVIFENVKNFEEIDFVVVGLDRNFNYEKLTVAQQCIMQGQAHFYATNTDATLPDKNIELPGAGCMVAALEICTSQKPKKVFGKPSPNGITKILEKTNTPKDSAVIFGDRLDTDIRAGNRAEIKTVLVLTGVTSREYFDDIRHGNLSIDEECIPDLFFNSLDEIIK
jgi:4-nitrophenyl phosphatase